jgi:hypothetical protein
LNLAALLAAAAASVTPWSAPAALSPCAAGTTAHVVFPSDSPSDATGAGAIVWSAAASCPGGEGARVAAIGAGDQPGPSAIPRAASGRPLPARGPLVAAGAPHGQVAIAGSALSRANEGLLVQGAAGGPFTTLQPGGSSTLPPLALATGYLGDVALASPPARLAGRGADTIGAFDVHVERFYSSHFGRAIHVRTAASAPVHELTLAIDYRSEVLAVWVQGGAIYARVLPARGAAQPLQRLARAGAHPHLAALLSDDGRAIVAWSEQQGARTSVYIDRSGSDVRFGAAQLLERFKDPDELSAPAASPSLVRLSSESVMLAWAGSAAGHWVVRTASVYRSGVGAPGTIATPGADVLLACLTPGPAADALVLWTQPPPGATGRPDFERQSIFAARGFDAAHQRTAFGPPELVAAPAPVRDLDAGFDPDSDRAVAVWQGEADRIEYSVRARAGSP